MSKRNRRRAWLFALLSPSAALALGLGDIHLKSTLNAPLDAEIDVLSANAGDLADLKANLASRDEFNRNGLDYPSFLGTVTLTPTTTPDGRQVIHVHSSAAADEPFATLLVEVDWPRGHLVREYTVLLDPPVFSPAPTSNAAVSVPSAAAGASSGVSPSAASQPVAAPAASAASSEGTVTSSVAGTARSEGSGAGDYRVHTGDTLSGIAARLYPGGDRTARERELVAIYRGNAAAFDGNMNVLRAGTVLKVPSEADLAAISPSDAAGEVHSQFAAFRAAQGSAGGRLRLVPPTENGSAENGPAENGSGPVAGSAQGPGGSAANAALRQQVQQLQAQLADSQRLLQVRSGELAALQARLAQKPNPAAAGPAPTPGAAPSAVPPTIASAQPPAVVVAPAASPAPTPAAPAAPAVTPAPAPTATPAPSPSAATASKMPPAAQGNSLLDLVEEYWYVPAGLLAILLALIGVRIVRSRQEEAFDRSLGRLQPAFEPTATATHRSTDTVPVRAITQGQQEQSYRVEESGSHEQPDFQELHDLGGTASTGQHVAIDDTVSEGTPVALDQGDPLAEADFHMAYGLYDQAADLVQIAITREPGRRDLKLKLLEVFFVWGNRERFLQCARELVASRAQALPGEWEKVVIMGRQIAPDDPLFGEAGGLAGAAAGGVDLNLEGGQNRVDFDLLGEPSVASTGAQGGGVDLDLGAALGESEPTGEARQLGDSGVDFVLDDPERGNDSTGSTREMPTGQGNGASGNTATVQTAATVDADAPTVEQPQLRTGGEHPTIREKLDAATRAGMLKADQTAELALDDLGLDLGAFHGSTGDTGLQEVIADTREPVADDTATGTHLVPDVATGTHLLPDGADASHAVGDAPTMLAGLDDDTRRLLDAAHAGHSAAEGRAGAGQPKAADPTPPAAPAATPTATGTWMFTDTDFELAAPKPAPDAPTELVTQITPAPEIDVGSTSRLAALDIHDLDMDLGDLAAAAPSGNGLDLDVGLAGTGETTKTQKLAVDAPLPELEPATMSEVGTKLDLARAYMDMGDPDGARSILAEVLAEGSVSQKQEARRLMDTLPG